MKYAGIVFTVLSVGMGIGAAVMFANAEAAEDKCRQADRGGGDCGLTGLGETIGAWAFVVGGVVHLSVGLPLWIVGATEVKVSPLDPRAIDQYRRRQAPQGLGLRLRATF